MFQDEDEKTYTSEEVNQISDICMKTRMDSELVIRLLYANPWDLRLEEVKYFLSHMRHLPVNRSADIISMVLLELMKKDEK